MTQEEKMLGQRAAVMGLLTNFLEQEEEKTMKDVKSAILACLTTLSEFDCMVGDWIEVNTLQAAKQHCEEELALEAVREMLA